jgi:uncharacterized protein (TIGR00369 family)
MQHGPGQSLDVRLLSLEPDPGMARCAFTAQEVHCNGLGILHGGVICTMLDIAMSAAALGALRLAGAVPTLELKTSFLAAARPGPLEATGRVRRLGRTIAFLEGELLGPEGEVLATASATVRVVMRDKG